MLRQAVVRKIVLRGSTKRFLAAATSSQKRALNKDQLEGRTSAPAVPPPSSAPSSTAATSGGGSGGGTGIVLAALGLAAAGGAVYYYSNSPMESKSPLPVLIPAAVKEDDAPTTTVATAKEEEKDTPSTTMEETKAVKVEKAPDVQPQHRVSTIEVPAKMKNSAAVATGTTSPPATPHPEQGNRVSMHPKKSQVAKPIDDTSMTEKALTELRAQQTEQAAQALLESHQSVWATMDAQFFSDLDALNPSQLKARIVQLATEMKDRTRWEAVRLKEFLAMKEKETGDK